MVVPVNDTLFPITKLLKSTQVTDVPLNLTLTPEVPLVPEEPDVPLVPEEPELPLVPLVPEEPELPLVPEEPDVPLVPEEPEVPLVPDGVCNVVTIYE